VCEGPDSNVVNECPVSKLHDGGLQRLHCANRSLVGRSDDESTCEIDRSVVVSVIACI